MRADLAATDCIHCSLPIPLARRNRGDPFCCEGCLRVHELIRGAGLTRYYDLGGGSSTPAATLRPNSFAWLDRLLASGDLLSGGPADARDAASATGQPKPPGISGDTRPGGSGDPVDAVYASDPSQPRRLTLDVQGVHCAACVWLLRELFRRRPGACDLRVNPALGQAEVTWIPAQCDLRGYFAEAERFGYAFGPRAKETSRRSRGLLVRLGICAAAAMNVMIFSLCFYAGLGPADGRLYTLFGQLNLGLTLAAVLVGGWVFFRAAMTGLRSGLVHLDLPIALGIMLAFAGSVYAFLTAGPRASYFDTVAIFVTLMLVGRVLQERVLERNRNSLLASQGVGDLHARRVRHGTVEAIRAVEIQRGDELWVVSGDLVPVESTLLPWPTVPPAGGVSRAGTAPPVGSVPAAGATPSVGVLPPTGTVPPLGGEISLDWITGESRGQTVKPGDTIPAGASNAGQTLLRLTAREDFDQSRLNSLLQGPERLEAERRAPRSGRGPLRGDAGPAQRWWHRVGTVYVLGVLFLAALGFILWAGHDLRRALMVTVSILVVTCPCAIGLATPLAHEMVHTALRRRGIFLREGSFLERALAIRRVIFDKTGTLTLARLALRPRSREVLLRLDVQNRAILFALAARSNHPASRCLADELRAQSETGATAAEGGEVRELPGQGLEWRRDERLYRLGRRAFALGAGTETGSEVAPGGDTCFTVDGRLLASFSFLEEIRHDAVEEIQRLERAGIDVRLLSGDTRERTREVAVALGIPEARFEGGLSPRAKADRVRDLNRGDTMMVGDGLNDSPSFDAAFCTATPAVDRPSLPSRADLYYLGEGVGAVRRTIFAARQLRRVLRYNLAFALFYNAAVLSMGFAGLVSPLLAAILMPLSSLSVVGHTVYRLSRKSKAWMS